MNKGSIIRLGLIGLCGLGLLVIEAIDLRDTKKLIEEGKKMEEETAKFLAQWDEDKKKLDEIQKNIERCMNSPEGSIELARSVGVPEDQILHNMDEVDKFFME